MRIMAIDYGKKRVGIAISDPLCVLAQPLVTLKVKSQKELIRKIKVFIYEKDIRLILIGNPLTHSGRSGKMSQEVQRFAKRLKKSKGIEIKLWDERFTSRYALKAMRDIGIKRTRDKIDQIAASIMLSEYLKTNTAYSV